MDTKNEVLYKILNDRGWLIKNEMGVIPEMALLNNIDVYIGKPEIILLYGIGKMHGKDRPVLSMEGLPFNPSLYQQTQIPFQIRTDAEVKANGHPDYLYKRETAYGTWEYFYKKPASTYFVMQTKTDGPIQTLPISPEKALELSTTDSYIGFTISVEIGENELRYMSELPKTDRYIDVFTIYFGRIAEAGIPGFYGVPKLRSKAIHAEPIDKCKSLNIVYTLDF